MELLKTEIAELKDEDPVSWARYCDRDDYRTQLMRDSGGTHDQNEIFYQVQKRMVEWSKEALPRQK